MTERRLCPAQVSEQVAPPLQLREHEPVQVMSQLEFPSQVALPLSPTVTPQLEPEAHDRLHERPQAPEQVLLPLHRREQLEPAQPEPVRSHEAPPEQVQLAPVHCGGTVFPESELPQPRSEARASAKGSGENLMSRA